MSATFEIGGQNSSEGTLASEREIPVPSQDWIGQGELARLLGVSRRTIHNYSQKGLLRRYEHGVLAAGRRIYSRELLRMEVEKSLRVACGESECSWIGTRLTSPGSKQHISGQEVSKPGQGE
jgi:hypothetical protein